MDLPGALQCEVEAQPDEQPQMRAAGLPRSPIQQLQQRGERNTGLFAEGWSFSGNPDRRDVNQMFLQPFLALQATKTLTVTLQSETTANWEVTEGRWAVPINVLFSKLSTFGVFPASYQVGVGGFPVHPDVGPLWKIRGAIVILLPNRR